MEQIMCQRFVDLSGSPQWDKMQTLLAGQICQFYLLIARNTDFYNKKSAVLFALLNSIIFYRKFHNKIKMRRKQARKARRWESYLQIRNYLSLTDLLTDEGNRQEMLC